MRPFMTHAKLCRHWRHWIVLSVLIGACDADNESGGAVQGATSSLAAKGVVVTKDGSDEAIAPVAQISFPNGTAIGFFELSPGELSTLEWGPVMASPPVDRRTAGERLSPVKLYERLAGAKAPLALAQAQARRDARAASDRGAGGPSDGNSAQPPRRLTRGASAPAGELNLVQQALIYYDCQNDTSYDAWFNCTFCDRGNGAYDYTWLHRGGDGWFQQNDVWYGHSTVSVYGGDILRFKNEERPWWSWSTVQNVTIPNGYWVRRTTDNTSVDRDIRSTVSESSGDGYHWCAYGNPLG